MSSILTNNGAMVALQTLKGINKSLQMTQDQISTGKKVANARDNSALWAIASVMQSDVMGFKAISESLDLGTSTIAVGRSASEQVNSLLQEVKQKIVAAQEDNVDRTKIQNDLSSLRDQISSIVGAAQFNGLNLLTVDPTTPAGTTATNTIAEQITNTTTQAQVNVLSSLDRSGTGVVSSNITVAKNDLSTTAQVAGTVAQSATTIAATAITANTNTIGATGTETFGINGDATTAQRQGNRVLSGDTYSFAATFFDKLSATGVGTDITSAVTYVAKAGDTTFDIASQLATRMNVALAEAGYGADYTAAAVNNGDGTAEFTITNNTGTAGSAAFAATDLVVTTGGTAGGGLEILDGIDVSTADGAEAGLAAIETLIQSTVTAAASFGTSQKRTEIQRDFIQNLTDSLTSGIGSLVDANMEEASARLQALQVQQQLGIQALSIANQAPQNLLSLFR